jgi:Skp family chaperone for outer membrane proteins
VKRVFVYLSALVGFGGMVFLAGQSAAQQAGAPPVTQTTRPTVAVFNMAAVMRDFGKAKHQVYLLNEKKVSLSGELAQWRTSYIETQKKIQLANDPAVKATLEKTLVDLARKIEDKDREINKILNDDASKIISGLYDDIKTVVDKTAEMNGYHIVFAYPDAVTPEEKNNPMLKELKLKPPAAQPFFVSPQIDITAIVVTTLNKWYPAPAVPTTPPQPQQQGAQTPTPQPGVPNGQPQVLPVGGGPQGVPPTGGVPAPGVKQ